MNEMDWDQGGCSCDVTNRSQPTASVLSPNIRAVGNTCFAEGEQVAADA